MTPLDRLIAWATAQLGTREQGENNVVYNTDYYGAPVLGPAYPWCLAFLWDGFQKTGLSAVFCGGAKTAYCPYVMSWAQAHGCWTTGPYQVGDLLLYDWDGDGVADHIGLCTAVSGGYCSTIEGNVRDQVAACTRYPGEILGAYRPAYPAEDFPEPEPVPEVYTVQAGDSLWKISREQLHDENRWREIQALNGLTTTVIYPGQLLRLPVSDSDTSADPPELTPPLLVPLPLLRRGDQGAAVTSLQALLQRWSYALPVAGPDGAFGPETETALRAFQRDMELPPTGETDIPTWRTLIPG